MTQLFYQNKKLDIAIFYIFLQIMKMMGEKKCIKSVQKKQSFIILESSLLFIMLQKYQLLHEIFYFKFTTIHCFWLL